MGTLQKKHTISFTAQWNGTPETNHIFKISERISGLLLQGVMEDTIPFLTLSYTSTLTQEITQFYTLFEGKTNLVILGIGGSAIGTKALLETLFPQQYYTKTEKKVWVLDNIDEEYITNVLAQLDAKTTAILAISKSGETIETVSQYFVCKAWLQQHIGTQWHRHCAVITDAQEGFLREEANTYALCSASIHPHLGGRYSVISAVGLIPMAFLGIDWEAIIEGARDFTTYCIAHSNDIENNPAWKLALWQFFTEKEGFTETIFFPYIPRFTAWGSWFSQLWAESLGKSGKGTMPIPAQGVLDQHSLQQMFLDGRKNKTCIFLRTEQQCGTVSLPKNLPTQWQYLEGKTLHEIFLAEYFGTRSSFLQHNIPYVEYQIPEITPYHIGKMVALFEATTLITGYLLQIDPLNQPAVEYGKNVTKKILHSNIRQTTICAENSVNF